MMDVLIYDNFGAHDRRHIYTVSPTEAEIVEPFYLILPDGLRPAQTPGGVTIYPDDVTAPVYLADTLRTAVDGMPVMVWRNRDGRESHFLPGTYGV